LSYARLFSYYCRCE